MYEHQLCCRQLLVGECLFDAAWHGQDPDWRDSRGRKERSNVWDIVAEFGMRVHGDNDDGPCILDGGSESRVIVGVKKKILYGGGAQV